VILLPYLRFKALSLIEASFTWTLRHVDVIEILPLLPTTVVFPPPTNVRFPESVPDPNN
jgi:hypothetical protein